MVRLKVDPVTISRRGSADLAILTTLFANYPSALRYSCPDQSCIIMQNWELHKKTVTVCHKIHPCHCILTNMNIQTSWVSLASVWYGRHFQLSEAGAFPMLLLNWARVWKTMLFCGQFVVIFGPYWPERAKWRLCKGGDLQTGNWGENSIFVSDFATLSKMKTPSIIHKLKLFLFFKKKTGLHSSLDLTLETLKFRFHSFLSFPSHILHTHL